MYFVRFQRASFGYRARILYFFSFLLKIQSIFLLCEINGFNDFNGMKKFYRINLKKILFNTHLLLAQRKFQEISYIFAQINSCHINCAFTFLRQDSKSRSLQIFCFAKSALRCMKGTIYENSNDVLAPITRTTFLPRLT